MHERTCSVPECGKPHQARGYCKNHYRNWHRTGNPVAIRTYVKGGRTCSFPGCEKPHGSVGLCVGHKAQKMSGKPLSPLSEYRRAATRDEQGRKQCRDCDGWFPEDAYRSAARNTDGLSAICGTCDRGRKVKASYGITLNDYLRLLESQGGVCAVCRGTNRDGRELAVDHDHGCCPGRRACGKCVRGLLCSSCNAGLGMFREDLSILDAAAAYLKRRTGNAW